MATAQAPEHSDSSTLAEEARALLARSRHGALATIARDGGHPHASLVAVATSAHGAPLVLISGLAVHTKNLEADPRASVLVAESGASDPLTAPRLTVVGVMARSQDEDDRARYLAAHPDAAQFAKFSDFGFWRLEITSAYYVGGFGRIRSLRPEDLRSP